MITLTEFSGKNVGVFGLGKAGEAAIASLLAGGANVFAWDDKLDASGQASEVRNDKANLSPVETWPWQTLAALVLSPGVPLTHPVPHKIVTIAKQHNCPIVGEVELLFRAQPDARYVAITGTNGKSTTTTLIGHILQQANIRCEVGGNLGTPALALAPLGKDGLYVLELSSYQLDLVHSTRFNVAVWLNITPDHIDRHGDIQGYIAAKKHIFERQQKEDVAIIAVDDEYSRGIRDGGLGIGGGKVVSISAQQKVNDGVYVENGLLYDTASPIPNPPSLIPISTLTGRHNWQNAAASYAAARACGVAPDVIYAAMKTFAGLRHRLQLVATINGVRFINDSKATNADATQNALAPYEHIYWIAGGKAKAGGIETLSPFFPKIAHAFLIGEAQEIFAKTLEGKAPYTCCGTLEVALQQAATMAFAAPPSPTLPPSGREGTLVPSPACGGGLGRGAVVLLSPACASFDQFKSFEHRGDVFCELVESLGEGAHKHAS